MPHEGGHNEPRFLTLLHILCNRLIEPPHAPPNGSVAIMEAILGAGANVNPRSSIGCTPLMRACVRKNFEAARLLMEFRADPRIVDDRGYDALRLAIQTSGFGSSCGMTRETADCQ